MVLQPSDQIAFVGSVNYFTNLRGNLTPNKPKLPYKA